MGLIKNFNIKSEVAGVLQGDITIYVKYFGTYIVYGIVVVLNSKGCVIDFELFEENSEKEVVLNFKERETVKDALNNYVKRCN